LREQERAWTQPERHGRPCAGHLDRKSAVLQAIGFTGTRPVRTTELDLVPSALQRFCKTRIADFSFTKISSSAKPPV
jgi:hypothetical protein